MFQGGGRLRQKRRGRGRREEELLVVDSGNRKEGLARDIRQRLILAFEACFNDNGNLLNILNELEMQAILKDLEKADVNVDMAWLELVDEYGS